jgi:hypothetical protein
VESGQATFSARRRKLLQANNFETEDSMGFWRAQKSARGGKLSFRGLNFVCFFAEFQIGNRAQFWDDNRG